MTNHNVNDWEILINLAQAGKALAKGNEYNEDEINAYHRLLYKTIFMLLQRSDSTLHIKYDWGIIDLNVLLKVEIAAWKDGQPGTSDDTNMLFNRGLPSDYHQQLKIMGFSDDEIDNFIEAR